MQIDPTSTKLFTPLTFTAGHTAVRNRLVLAPMTTYSSNSDGTITPEEIEFLRRRARGVGMAITAACRVIDHGHAFDGQWSCAGDEMIPSLASAARAIHEGHALAILQIHHGGRLCPASILGHAPLAPSDIPARRPGADVPRPMTEVEIEETIKAFGAAARRAIVAGYDGVEIHGANGYLLQQFFSPHANRRSDQWGGSLENRAAFPIAVLEEVQKVVRRNAYRPFAIGYRLSPEEVDDPGITLADTLQLVEGLVACRPDWLHISTNDYFAGSLRDDADRRPRARVIADCVRHRTSVIGVGSILSPAAAEAVLADGPDLVAMGRTLVMEPEWAQKVVAGNEPLRTCLPMEGGDTLLSIPPRMYRKMLGRPGWLPLCSQEPHDTPVQSIPVVA
ncbi:MAG TPA: NADH-dependent flavin oxidoreductase [Candidatus Kapabacteria bacterium]|nr:NADH-dependent flavin oxidoreductase [Candidatus Kapabacteria bacterium]